MEDNLDGAEDRTKSRYTFERKATWYIRTAQLAVAVAIIKSKPAGVSSRQHAENLASKLRQKDETWKVKAQDLREEVLRLRQELLLTQLLSKPRNRAESGRGDDVVKLLSQDLTNVQQSEPDSGCENSNNTQTPHSSSIPSSSIRPGLVIFPHQKHSREHVLSKQMQFLQHLCGLGRLAGPSLSVNGDDTVVWDSVLHLLSSVLEAFKKSTGDRPPPQPALLLQASQVVAQTLEQESVHRRPPTRCLGQLEDSLKELLDLMLSNSRLNKFTVQEMLTECLKCLGGSNVVRSVLIRLLLAHINHLARQLWSTCQRSSDGQQQQVDWSRYENSFYLFWLLEQLAQAGRAVIDHRDLQIQLETHVLPLSGEFPLFALYMWRIRALLSPSGTTGL